MKIIFKIPSLQSRSSKMYLHIHSFKTIVSDLLICKNKLLILIVLLYVFVKPDDRVNLKRRLE